MFGDDENEEEILDRVRLVRFPPLTVFFFVFVYGCIAAWVVRYWETWTYVESLYFIFISILTVGKSINISIVKLDTNSYFRIR